MFAKCQFAEDWNLQLFWSRLRSAGWQKHWTNKGDLDACGQHYDNTSVMLQSGTLELSGVAHRSGWNKQLREDGRLGFALSCESGWAANCHLATSRTVWLNLTTFESPWINVAGVAKCFRLSLMPPLLLSGKDGSRGDATTGHAAKDVGWPRNRWYDAIHTFTVW